MNNLVKIAFLKLSLKLNQNENKRNQSTLMTISTYYYGYS